MAEAQRATPSGWCFQVPNELATLKTGGMAAFGPLLPQPLPLPLWWAREGLLWRSAVLSHRFDFRISTPDRHRIRARLTKVAPRRTQEARKHGIFVGQPGQVVSPRAPVSGRAGIAFSSAGTVSSALCQGELTARPTKSCLGWRVPRQKQFESSTLLSE